MSSCETQNKYVVYPAHADGSKRKESIFKAKEKSSCISRTCLSGVCRPFNVKLEHEEHGGKFLWLHRECTCTLCCLNRPSMDVYCCEGSKEPGDLIGKIVNPFTCLSKEVQIFDSQNVLKYVIEAESCQLGLWCKCPCESCQTIEFQILDANRNRTNCRLMKKSPGCLKAAISDADNFSLIFPHKATSEERALLMAAVIMIDFMYFEENPSKNPVTQV